MKIVVLTVVEGRKITTRLFSQPEYAHEEREASYPDATLWKVEVFDV